MADDVVMGLWGGKDLRVVVAVVTAASRRARDAHRAGRAAASLLAEALTASALLSAVQLQKSDAKLNFQLECDGPLRGLLVESDGQGNLRGYAKNPLVDLEGGPGEYRWRPALGNAGFISILRDRGEGDYFRSSVQLQAFDLPKDFQHYFLTSEQVETGVALEVVEKDGELLGEVAGVLLQALPGGDVETLRAESRRLSGGALREALMAPGEASAGALLSALLPDAEVEFTARYPLQWSCPCSKDRVLRALLTLGPDELQDLLEKEGQAVANCQFCSAEYVVGSEELKALLDRMK